MSNVLCVVAHPDDEVLGAGGALAKHAENGDGVTCAALCYSRASWFFHAACAILGAGTVESPEFQDQALDTTWLKEIVVNVAALGVDCGDPDIVYTHHPEDLNLDHALTARAVLTAFRPKPGEKPRTILACEVLSSTEYTYPRAFQPNWYVALTGDQLERKIEAMRCYETELCEWPHPRSILGIRNLAALRGQESGVERAEAFQLLRKGPA